MISCHRSCSSPVANSQYIVYDSKGHGGNEQNRFRSKSMFLTKRWQHDCLLNSSPPTFDLNSRRPMVVAVVASDRRDGEAVL